jgi:hypothetical protein
MLSLSPAILAASLRQPRFGAKSHADDEQSAVSLANRLDRKCADGGAFGLVHVDGVLHQIKIASGSLLEIGSSSQTLWEITKVVGA